MTQVEWKEAFNNIYIQDYEDIIAKLEYYHVEDCLDAYTLSVRRKDSLKFEDIGRFVIKYASTDMTLDEEQEYLARWNSIDYRRWKCDNGKPTPEMFKRTVEILQVMRYIP